MKKYLLSVLFLVFLQSGNLFAITGEIIIRTINGTAPKLRVTINANSYIWKWDAANQKVIPETRSYPITYNNGSFSYKFDACNDINDGLDYIPWGLMDFAVSTLDANNNPVYTVHFTLDLRDQDWSVNEYKYPSHDTYIQRNLSANRWEIYCNGYTYTISEGSCYEIWSLWMDGATPNTINLKVPITLMNRTEGGITDFGYLIANGSEQVNSGQAGNFRFDTQNMVSHGTTEETSNGRKYSFKWDPYNVDKVLTQNIYSSALDFTIPENKNSKGITRRFHQVYSLTAKNDIEGTGISAGTLYFKDPTTTIQLQRIHWKKKHQLLQKMRLSRIWMSQLMEFRIKNMPCKLRILFNTEELITSGTAGILTQIRKPTLS